METNQTNTGAKKVFIATVIALLLLNGVTMYFLFSEKQEKTEVVTQKTSLEQDYHSVSDSLEAKKDEIDQLRGKNAAMDKLIAEKEQLIDQEQKALEEEHSKNSLTIAQLNHARGMISQYEILMASMQQQLNDYKAQTAQLTVDKEELSADLGCEQDANTQLTETNTVLSKKVDAGSYLQIPRVEVEAVKTKHNGQEVDVEKAKAAERLKVSFETGVNKVIDPGKISFYVRIINPRGETLASDVSGSGVIPGSDEAKPVQYTRKADLYYTQNNKKVVVYWSRYINDPGVYRVEVYQGDKVVGHGAVRLS
ncbi:MAG TPA: hypothetical protein VG603_10535 [Chitinophagales bacterium]|nr:hypothetical protein [Chitinophagales bacterium]